MTDRPSAVVVQPGSRPARWEPYFGAVPRDGGVMFRLWAPEAQEIALVIREGTRRSARAPRKLSNGIWELLVPDVRAGAEYAYSIDGNEPHADPVSRFQPDGVHGWSEVIDSARFEWHDGSWAGADPARLVIYELHVGTFAGDGRFADVADRLEDLRDLGITAIELMPLADFPGRRNWGYDGVALFAPSRAYGRPDDLRALVDRAHALGLAVIVDVVYNHLGPEGATLPLFSPQFLTDAHITPWGRAVNLDRAGSDLVRRLLIENALHWIHEYHVDGLRLDATHALIDDSATPFIHQLTDAIHGARELRTFVFAEDHRNLATMVTAADRGGWGLDGVWADDFHHVLRRMIAGDTHGYYADYRGTTAELASTLRRGWLFVGQVPPRSKAPRGTDPSRVPMRASIVCLQNHDQIGNRALGERLHHVVDAAQWRAAVTLLLTSPMTPLLFMGQEWAASTPFQFFTDFEPSLGQRVIEGRRREFRAFPGFASDEAAALIPSPQDDQTFEASRLRWAERKAADHAAALALHRRLLHLRAERAALQASSECTSEAEALDESTILVRRAHPGCDGSDILICARLRGSGRVRVEFGGAAPRTLLSTEDPDVTADPQPIAIDADGGALTFTRPGAIVLEIEKAST